jgi:hypothetical protein
MAAPYNDFMNDSPHSIRLGRELPLFDGTFDKEVVALLEGHGDARKIAVKR